ncbi:unnamed protein product [Hyaloperonospora brassicae]|uniref:RxLR effector candidate protein n=1 Tax=Hyaloperonospora brassicae TaxID=162125 RepID=A0AAV0TL98_HYABA|nr:unnamed protein product [Hyaloperonospora brassicae]
MVTKYTQTNGALTVDDRDAHKVKTKAFTADDRDAHKVKTKALTADDLDAHKVKTKALTADDRDAHKVKTKALDFAAKDEERWWIIIPIPAFVTRMIFAIPRAIYRAIKGAFRLPGNVAHGALGKKDAKKLVRARHPS